jgi:hypothetical protein
LFFIIFLLFSRLFVMSGCALPLRIWENNFFLFFLHWRQFRYAASTH